MAMASSKLSTVLQPSPPPPPLHRLPAISISVSPLRFPSFFFLAFDSEHVDHQLPRVSALDTSPPPDDKLTGALSKYLWSSEPRPKEPLVRFNERRLAIESVLQADNLPVALDRVRSKLSPGDCNAILRRFGEQEKWQQVCLVFDWMKVNRKLRSPTVTSFISLMGKAGLPDKALRAYRELTNLDMKKNNFICNTLFKTLIDAGYVERAFTLFDEIKLDGFTPDLYTYNILIAGCAKHRGAYSKAETLLEEMYARGLKPDKFVYASLLHVCATFGLEAEVKSLCERMKTDNIALTLFHYSALLNLHAEKGNPDEAEEVLQQMQVAGIPLNEVILNSLIKAYSNGGQLEKARNLFNEMPSLGFSPGYVSYILMLDLYCKAGKLDEAQLFFQEMKEKSLLTGHGYCILISAYSRKGKVDQVEALMKELESRENGISELTLFNTLLKSYCELGMVDSVMRILKRMDEESVVPDRATFNILICYFCKEKLFDLALRTLNDMKARRLRPNLNSYGPLIAGFAKSGKVDKAVDLFGEMNDAQVSSSSAVFESLIEALCKEKRADEAFTYLKKMLEVNLSPMPSCLEQILILAGSRSDMLEEILEGNMKPALNLKQVDFVAVISAYQEQGYQDAIFKLVNFIREHSYASCNGDLKQVVDSLLEAGLTEASTRLEQTPGIPQRASPIF